MNEKSKKMRTAEKMLPLSIVMLLVSLAMFVTSTFSWFTDTATTGINRIVSGSLNISAYYSTDGFQNWKSIVGETTLFRKEDWEPGVVDVVYLKLVNDGSLSLKYRVSAQCVKETVGKSVTGEDIHLSSLLNYSFIPNISTPFAARGEALAAARSAGLDWLNTISSEVVMKPGETTYAAVVITMPSGTGNEANFVTGTDQPSITLGLEVLATQASDEYDSYGNDYDTAAAFPESAIK